MDFSFRRYASPKMLKLLNAIHLMGGLIAGVAWVVLAFPLFRRFFCNDGQGWGRLAEANRPAVERARNHQRSHRQEALHGAKADESIAAADVNETLANKQCEANWTKGLFGVDSGEAMRAMGLQQVAIGNGIKASDTGRWFRNLIARLEIRFVFALSVLLCMTAVAIYLTRPPVKLPAMEPVLHAPNAELLRHPSDRPAAGCDVDYETSSCAVWYHRTEN